jgi:hypothetical protein
MSGSNGWLTRLQAGLQQVRQAIGRRWATGGFTVLYCLLLLSLTLLQPAAALAGRDDDRYDGDIFALYAGNGSLIPPRVTLAEAMQRDRPILLVLYIDDSRDCKQYATVVSQLQAFYGRAADFLAIRVDSLPLDKSATLTDPSYYYQGVVPQTVVFDAAGKVALNEAGALSFERVDDVFREVFDLLPRSESVELKRRQVNEITTELSQ